jgi:hypothetical protein
LPRFLQTQLLLELQRAHARDGAEMLSKSRWAHVRAVCQVVDVQPPVWRSASARYQAHATEPNVVKTVAPRCVLHGNHLERDPNAKRPRVSQLHVPAGLRALIELMHEKRRQKTISRSAAPK